MAQITKLKVGQTVYSPQKRRFGGVEYFPVVIKEIDLDGKWVKASINNNPVSKYLLNSISKWKVKEPVKAEADLNEAIEGLKKKLGEVLYRDVEKKAETALGGQALPPKHKLIQLIYSYINQFTEETIKKMLASYSQRNKLVDELIDGIVAYY